MRRHSHDTWAAWLGAIDRSTRREVAAYASREDSSIRAEDRRIDFHFHVTFDHPVDVVFRALTDLSIAARLNWPVRTYHVASGSDASDPYGVGAERGFRPIPGVIYRERILEKVPNECLRWTLSGGAPVRDQEGTLSFRAEGRKTVLREDVSLTLAIPRALGFVTTPLAKRIFDVNVATFVRAREVLRADPNFDLRCPEMLVRSQGG